MNLVASVPGLCILNTFTFEWAMNGGESNNLNRSTNAKHGCCCLLLFYFSFSIEPLNLDNAHKPLRPVSY